MSSDQRRARTTTDQATGLFADAARQIGRRLVASAIWHENRCNWTGDEIDYWGGAWRVLHRSVDGGLYNGTSGIAWFLAHLARVVPDESFHATARGALEHSLREAEQTLSPSLWCGSAGTACVAVALGARLGERALVARGHALADRLAERCLDPAAASAGALDVIAGLAGTCTALTYLARRGAGPHVVAACDAVARELLRSARRRPAGWSWPMNSGEQTHADLCGVAHGASGVAAALIEAYALLGDAAFLAAAQEGMRYEASWFDRRVSNWPDLRETSATAPAALTYPDFWCHGGAGIGVVRLRAYAVTGSMAALADAGAALQSVRHLLDLMADPQRRAADESWNLSVCHGLGSVAELLLYAHGVLQAPHYLSAARNLGSAALQELERRGRDWPCGVPGGGATPGLMLGLAGIGLWYLRLADPARTPPATVWV